MRRAVCGAQTWATIVSFVNLLSSVPVTPGRPTC
jgi:hypothetical protein